MEIDVLNKSVVRSYSTVQNWVPTESKAHNDTTLQNFSAGFHHYKVRDTVVARDLAESSLPQDPSDSSTRPHFPSVKGGQNGIPPHGASKKGRTFHVQ
jgi:hypothetical protein